MALPLDWLSRLLDLVPVRGALDLHCLYGAPWRIDQAAGAPGEIPYHLVLRGSAVLEDPAGGTPRHLVAGDLLMLPDGGAHVLHDGGGMPAVPARKRARLNLTISRNAGPGDRLDLLCGRFVLSPPHDRLLRDYLPGRLVVSVAGGTLAATASDTGAQLAGLVALMRREAGADSLGGRALLNALSTTLFALALRRASETAAPPPGLLALAGHPRLAPALAAMFREPARAWTLPSLARLCHMSRATLVRHFQETLGRSASDLLTDIRMTMAANALRQASASTAAVGEAVGYRSEAAFQRAFKQHMGATPAQWRRRTRAKSSVASPAQTA